MDNKIIRSACMVLILAMVLLATVVAGCTGSFTPANNGTTKEVSRLVIGTTLAP